MSRATYHPISTRHSCDAGAYLAHKAGFNYCYTKKINTDNLLKQNLNHLSKHEILLLNQKIFD